MKRPRRITVAGWFFIIYAVLSFIPKVMVFFSPEFYDTAKDLIKSLEGNSILNIPFSVQLAHAMLGSVVMLVSGVYLLNGRNWARVTLVIWMLSVFIITILITGIVFTFYTKSLFAAIIIWLLYSKKSNYYFHSNNA